MCFHDLGVVTANGNRQSGLFVPNNNQKSYF